MLTDWSFIQLLIYPYTHILIYSFTKRSSFIQLVSQHAWLLSYIVFHESTFHESTFHESTFHESTFHESTFHESTFHESTFHEQVFFEMT